MHRHHRVDVVADDQQQGHRSRHTGGLQRRATTIDSLVEFGVRELLTAVHDRRFGRATLRRRTYHVERIGRPQPSRTVAGAE